MERSNSWFRWWRKKAREGQGQGGRPRHGEKVVVDGSEIRELVEDREAFGMLVDTKFRQLDADGDGIALRGGPAPRRGRHRRRARPARGGGVAQRRPCLLRGTHPIELCFQDKKAASMVRWLMIALAVPSIIVVLHT